MELFLKLSLTFIILTSAALSYGKKASSNDINSLKNLQSSNPDAHNKPSTYLKSLISYYQDINTALDQTESLWKSASTTVRSTLDHLEKYQSWLKDAVPNAKKVLIDNKVKKSKSKEIVQYINSLTAKRSEYDNKLFHLQLNDNGNIPVWKITHDKTVALADQSQDIYVNVSILAQFGLHLNCEDNDESAGEKFDLLMLIPLVKMLKKCEDCQQELEEKRSSLEESVLEAKSALCTKHGIDQDNYIKRHEQTFKYFVHSILSHLYLLAKIDDAMFDDFTKMEIRNRNLRETNHHYLLKLNKIMHAILEPLKRPKDEL